MKRGRFISLFVLAILSMALLAVVEVVWSVRSYREMRDSYNRQITSLFDEALWQYAGNIDRGGNINLGPIESLSAIVGEELRTSGITTRYSVELLLLIAGEHTVVSHLGDEIEPMHTLSLVREIKPVSIRLNVEDPHTKILASMQGMIILSIIATLLLILTLIYLLMTLFRAKSLERIRRDLTHNITHELRTPIAAARAATDTLRCTPEIAQSEALRKEYLEMTSAELEHLSLLVDSILRSSLDDESTVTLRPESVELHSTINEVVASLRLKYSSRNIEFYSDICESTRLCIDRATLRTILLNIIDNSIKYSDGVPHIEATATRHNTSIELSIEDHGIGIEPHEQRRVFDKFYRVSTAYRQNSQGYGLGLYHVRSLVERSGGKIELHSTLGQGTRITITLPTDDQTNNSRR